MQEKIWEVLENEKECAGGVTQLVHGDLAVRILGHRAQKLQETAEEIKAILKRIIRMNCRRCGNYYEKFLRRFLCQGKVTLLCGGALSSEKK